MRILCVTTMRNEGPFILEWIAHCRAIGVTDFLVFSNDCEDGTDEILAQLERNGVIVHCPHSVAEGESVQWHALQRAWRHPLRKECDWAVVCDVDEFINIHHGTGRISDLLDVMPDDVEAIAMPWRLFGNNGHAMLSWEPVTELYTRSAERECSYPIATTFFKSLFRLGGRFNKFGIHRPGHKNRELHGVPVWANGDGSYLSPAFAETRSMLSLLGKPYGRPLVECNHYSVKSAANFLIKCARGLPNRTNKPIDLAYWVERNFNCVENSTISISRRLRDSEHAQLAGVKQMESLVEKSQHWHMQKFRELIRNEYYYTLLSNILVTGSSQHIPREQLQFLLREYRNLEALDSNIKCNG